MREILFRGKRIDNGEWAEGYYVKTVDYRTDSAVHLIIELPSAFYPLGEIAREYEIDSSTIGQYTGLTDKNGRKIFEGDIVIINTSEKRKIKKYRVEFDNSIFGIRLSTNANDNTIIPLRSFDYIEIIKGEEND